MARRKESYFEFGQRFHEEYFQQYVDEFGNVRYGRKPPDPPKNMWVIIDPEKYVRSKFRHSQDIRTRIEQKRKAIHYYNAMQFDLEDVSEDFEEHSRYEFPEFDYDDFEFGEYMYNYFH